MDISLISATIDFLVPYIQAGKQVITSHLDEGLKAIVPAFTKDLYAAVKKFFSKESLSKKTLENAEAKPNDPSSIESLKTLLKLAMEDESFKSEIEALFKKLESETGQSASSIVKKVSKNYSMTNVTVTHGTIIQGDGNSISS